jgi:hypothetical protein
MTVFELLTLLATFYLTIAIMGVGFGTMLAGPTGASAAARFFFLRPLQALATAAQSLLLVVFGGAAAAAASLFSTLARALRRELAELGADVRWVLRRFDRR